jgi:prepilin-type N-terminal cleavage/methylation domain-containing protein/prepilin-type processing-associated H-X9-DG protein
MYARKGFTLIELLIGIAIISVLAALLMPALEAARQKAWQTKCLTNIKQQCLAGQFYLNDWKDSLPPVTYESDPDNPGYTRHFFGSYSLSAQDVKYDRGLLTPYVSGIRAIWQCPAVNPGDLISQVLPGNEIACAYAYNGFLGARWEEIPPGSWNYVLTVHSIQEVTQASRTLAFSDSAVNYTYGAWPNPNEYGNLRENWNIDWYPVGDWGVNDPDRDGTCHFRHESTANGGFWDGHATVIRPPRPDFLATNNNVDFQYLETSPYYDGK